MRKFKLLATNLLTGAIVLMTTSVCAKGCTKGRGAPGFPAITGYYGGREK